MFSQLASKMGKRNLKTGEQRTAIVKRGQLKIRGKVLWSFHQHLRQS